MGGKGIWDCCGEGEGNESKRVGWGQRRKGQGNGQGEGVSGREDSEGLGERSGGCKVVGSEAGRNGHCLG